ncbi:hypothetical protein HRR83_005859 [Exophiala dermatitidis]|uniref:Myb-like domain-containing protein n=1 Tax=Exophiala dermatitidis (strain ATCC 34100 / CBS 525.76 / NIH/UT8656) TaxID=858893 RepID=H6BUK6_EXODN|nr:uncharacterized protein HMPREF1120_03043 [Exophiala dermatitidis NIH/UT8656]KAJ4511009.1 hypothetical protein HRR75_005705 [Exophiala dermatitidis]EHY54881.1 hypothetical protein HMPREF1120_03043 [Exophiala dermatitidis NIH/UT8656]KAJ4513414.1 hypothetical protein HRR74_006228 [Exophiala dermatitidis]KAJ4547113.1 hypothetical protein HRR78_005211 [Exophiala dermatitidis]KAJ4568071.1 hypothetical protein HRR81_006985 [Exophiala dermatitidis]
MPFKWDAESERNLLIAAIGEMSAPPTTIWPAVAERLGHGLNGNACSQKFYKLKKESEKLLGENDTNTAPKTPKTSARKTNPSSTGTKRKRRAPEEAETPTKLAKKEETPSKSSVKQELDDDVKVKPEHVSDNEYPGDE